MTITFYLVVLNHHQVGVADELFNLLGDGFKFVALTEKNESKGDSTDYSTRPYLVHDKRDDFGHITALDLLFSSDICVFGGAEAQRYLRMRADRMLPSFDISEHWLKKGVYNIFSPRLFSQFITYHLFLNNKPVYKLCASGFASRDFDTLHMYRGRCFKWGYFTKNEGLHSINTEVNESPGRVKLMWCARFIKWKHPELPVLLAKRLSDNKIAFQIDMFGEGPELINCMDRSRHLGIGNLVSFRGSQSNESILKEMREHDVFLVTSDRNEGWGAVVNEAMGSGCTVIASDEIGAVPYLLKDDYNGKVFKSKNIDSLTEAVIHVIKNPSIRRQYAVNAYNTITQEWSPSIAARNLIHLSKLVLDNNPPDIETGPCSPDNCNN